MKVRASEIDGSAHKSKIDNPQDPYGRRRESTTELSFNLYTYSVRHMNTYMIRQLHRQTDKNF